MSSVNKVFLIGRLGKDPEIRYMTNGEAVANVSIATSESWKGKDGEKAERTEWHNLVFYRRLAEVVGEYLKKGALVYVEGKLQTRKWEKDGVTHYSTEIIVNEMTMLGGKSEGSGSGNSEPRQTAAAQPAKAAPAPARGKGPIDNYDDDIPFFLRKMNGFIDLV